MQVLEPTRPQLQEWVHSVYLTENNWILKKKKKQQEGWRSGQSSFDLKKSDKFDKIDFKLETHSGITEQLSKAEERLKKKLEGGVKCSTKEKKFKK